MSARRKGKPQQRVHVDTVPADQDLLTCGKCQQEFYLCDINAFIQHKISKCNKEACTDNDNTNDGGKGGGINKISHGGGGEEQTIAIEKLKPTVNFQTLFSNKDSLEKIIRDELARSEGHITRCNQHTSKVDAATITVYSEPSLFTCSTCKSVYSSSWFLIQHVQKAHGLCIYVEPSNSTSPKQHDDKLMGRVANLADSIDIKQDVTSPSAEPSNSPAISKDVFCTPAAPFIQSSARSWNPFPRPPSDLALIHPGLVSDQFRRLINMPFRPAGLDSTLQDIYSQRLRQLAGNPSNNTTNSPNNSPAPSSNQLILTDTPSAFSAPKKKDIEQREDKGYKCEICSKCFRFGATLAAHHRIHTGETPFKCTMCPQAYMLASQLKRHLLSKHKHPALATLEENTPSSTPESKLSKPEDDETESEEDGEPTDSQEFALCEAQAEAELFMVASQSQNPEEGVSSLLGDVMKKTGMDQIPQYKEAFAAALAENCPTAEDDEISDDCRSTEDSPPAQISDVNGIKEESRDSTTPIRRASSTSPSPTPAKVIKIEPEEWQSPEDRYRKDMNAAIAAAAQASMYQGIWFHPSNTRDFLQGPYTRATMFSPATNGLPADSSIKVSPKLKTNNVVISTSSPVNTSVNGPTRRRNDTCEYCGKIFKNCSNLTVHRRSHTGEKPYKCQLCTYACAQSSKLTRHMRTHGRMGKDVYRCKFCSMPFSVPSTLEKHMRKCMENSPSKLNHKGVENQPPVTSPTSATSLLGSLPSPSPSNLTGHMKTESGLSPLLSTSPVGSLNLSTAAMETTDSNSSTKETNERSSPMDKESPFSGGGGSSTLAGILTLNGSPSNITTSVSQEVAVSKDNQGIDSQATRSPLDHAITSIQNTVAMT